MNLFDGMEYYNAFFKEHHSPMLLVDVETLEIIDANQAACSFYQYNYEDMLKLKVPDINILTEDNIVYNMKLAARRPNNYFFFKHRLSTGEIRDVIVNSGMISLNGRKYLHAIIQDISGKKDMTEETAKLSSLIQIMFESLPFATWFKDLQGNYTFVNRCFEHERGLSKEEIIGKNDYDIFPKATADYCLASDSKVLSANEQGSFEEYTEGGKWFEAYKSSIIDEFGNLIGISGSTRDVTERMKVQEALRNAEQKQRQLLEDMIEMKDDFITLISHEFKTPIAVIRASVQMMEITYKNEMSDNLKKYIDKIKQNALRQQRLVDNLLDITKIKAGQMKINLKNIEIVSLTKEITESVKVFAEQKQLELSFQSAVPNQIVAIDEEKYERILLNLLSNAIKFTPHQKSILVKLSLQDEFIKLQIEDEGIGISEEDQSIIFEQFGRADNLFSRQAEGTGIGLYLVKLLVGELGGTILLKSKSDCGSSFTILLPVSYDTPQNTCQQINPDRINHTISLEFSDIIF